jgi:ribosomal protein L11 methyltransferase
MAPISWLAVTFATTAEAVDWVRMGLSSLSARERVRLAVRPTAASEWPYQLTLLFPDDRQGHSQWQSLQQKLSPLERSNLIATPEVSQQSQHQGQVPADPPSPQFAGQFVILPIGSEFSIPSEKMAIYLQPSTSFGSGYHPATLLSLLLIERHLQPQTPPLQVLDLGTGSGILGLACARLGAQVLALDNDPIAIQACQAAITENGLGAQMMAQVGSLGSGQQFGHWLGDDYGQVDAGEAVEQEFDVIVANLLARLHIALAPDYAASLKTARPGLLITAGYTQDYQPTLEETLSEAGFRLKARVTCAKWVALAHETIG